MHAHRMIRIFIGPPVESVENECTSRRPHFEGILRKITLIFALTAAET